MADFDEDLAAAVAAALQIAKQDEIFELRQRLSELAVGDAAEKECVLSRLALLGDDACPSAAAPALAPPRETPVLAKADGTPLSIVRPGGERMAHPPPTRLLFLPGFGENPELLDAFALDGLRSCFGTGCQVDVIGADHEMTVSDVEDAKMTVAPTQVQTLATSPNMT